MLEPPIVNILASSQNFLTLLQKGLVKTIAAQLSQQQVSQLIEHAQQTCLEEIAKNYLWWNHCYLLFCSEKHSETRDNETVKQTEQKHFGDH